MTYKRFLAMIATSTVVMFVLMYSTAYRFSHVWWSQTRFWMALFMGAMMAIVMLGFMLGMYSDKRKNAAIFAGSAILFALALFFARSQETVGDVAWMKAMIPHHSIAILTSERAKISDPRVRRLADEIILAQRREIAEMEALIGDIDGASNADGPAIAPTVPPVEGGSDDVSGAPSLVISDQPVVDGGVTIGQVKISSDAWIVVHRAAAGGGADVSRIVGAAFVMHGTTERVPVDLDAAVSPGETLYAMLHDDTGEIGTFEFGGPGTADQPLMQRGRPVAEAFVVR
jgi:hypothetical protein